MFVELITEIVKDLNSEETEYRCDSPHDLSRHLYHTLNKNGIPASLLTEHLSSGSTMEYMFTPGIIMKLYR